MLKNKFLRVLNLFKNQSYNYSEIQNVTGDWWDQDGIFRGLHSMNFLRVPFIVNNISLHRKLDKQCPEPLLGMNIIDIGCGGGILTEPLANLGANVTGIDSVENIEIAKCHLTQLKSELQNRISYKVIATSETYREDEPKYDACVFSEVVEHVPNVEDFIKSCVDMTKVNGFLFLTTINRTLLSRILAIYVAEYILKLVPKGIHSWDRFVKPEELTELLYKYGCEVRQIQGMTYNPITNTWYWFPNVSVNYAMYAIKTRDYKATNLT